MQKNCASYFKIPKYPFLIFENEIRKKTSTYFEIRKYAFFNI